MDRDGAERIPPQGADGMLQQPGYLPYNGGVRQETYRPSSWWAGVLEWSGQEHTFLPEMTARCPDGDQQACQAV